MWKPVIRLSGLALLALLTLVGAAGDEAQASDFNPTFSLALSDKAVNAHGTLTLTSTLPAGNHLLGQAFFLVPKRWNIAGDGAIANGDTVGSVSLDTDLNCNGVDDPPVTASLTDQPVTDPGFHAEWRAQLGPPLNLTMNLIVEVEQDDPDLDYQIAAAVFPTGTPPTPLCNPMTLIVTINGVSGMGSFVLTNPNIADSYRWDTIYLSAPTGLLEHIVGRSVFVCLGDLDVDNDGVCNAQDNCLSIANTNQLDSDADGFGNVCDNDDDADGFADTAEAFIGTDPLNTCSWPPDTDNSLLVDSHDVFFVSGRLGASTGQPLYTPRAEVASQNGVIDDDPFAEAGFFGQTRPQCFDSDGDTVPDINDNCPSVSNVGQGDNDSDGPGDACDPDDDNDTWTDIAETYITTDPTWPCFPNGWPPDIDDDSKVTAADVAWASQRFGTSPGNPLYTPRAEIASQDGFIGSDDVNAFNNRFGTNCLGLIF